MQKDNSYSRVLFYQSGVERRLCSLHLDKDKLLVDFKEPLTVVNQGLQHLKTEESEMQQIEIPQINHIHLIFKENKILATYQTRGRAKEHSTPINYKPNLRDGKYLHRFFRLLPKQPHFPINKKAHTDLDIQLEIPSEVKEENLAFDFWFGMDYSRWEEEKVQEALGLIYRTKEKGFYNIALGINPPFAIYISAFSPKETPPLQTTRLILFGKALAIK